MIRLLLFSCLFLTAKTGSFAQVLTSSNLPIIVLKTDGQPIFDEPKSPARLFVVEVEDTSGQAILADTSKMTPYIIGVESRGSTSQGYDKRGYAIELRDAQGLGLDAEILGMPKEDDWVLVGPFNDKSLLRDALAYHFAGQIMDWAPRVRLVEVVLDNDYRGVYLFTEKIKRDKNRVAVSKMKPTDLAGDQLTGGYIIKLDKQTGANFDGWESTFPPMPGAWQRSYFQYHYPKPEDIAPEQAAYIQNFIFEMETALDSPNFKDSLTGWPHFIEADSWIDYLLVNEISKNTDAYRLSTFMYKDRDSIDSRLHMGPVWDFNIAFGIGDYCEGENPAGWGFNFNDVCPNDGWINPFWWKKLMTDPVFREKLKTRWLFLRQNDWSNSEMIGSVDSMANLLWAAQTRNFTRFPILGQYIWPNSFIGPTWQSEVNFLKNWLTDRLAWMDGQIENMVGTSGIIYPIERVQPWPNPSREAVIFQYKTPGNSFVELELFNAEGRRVHNWGNLPTGEFAFFEMPKPDVAGVYFWKMRLNGKTASQGKLVFMN